MDRFRRFFSDALVFAWQRRGRLSFVLGLVGAACVLASVVLPWFGVPVAGSGHLLSPTSVVGREAPVAFLFKALSAFALGATVLLILRTPEPRPRVVRLVAILFAGLLLFPHAVM